MRARARAEGTAKEWMRISRAETTGERILRERCVCGKWKWEAFNERAHSSAFVEVLKSAPLPVSSQLLTISSV